MRCEDCPVNPGKSCVAERAPIFVGLYCLNWAPHGTEQERQMIRERSDLPYAEPGPSAVTIAATPPAEVDPKAALADVMLAGDVIEAITKATGIKAAVEMWSALTGHACRCNERKEMLNEASRKLLRWAGLAEPDR